MCEEETTTVAATTPDPENENATTTNSSNNNNNNNNSNNNNTTAVTTTSDMTPTESSKCGPNINLNKTIIELLKPGNLEKVLMKIRTQLSVNKGNLSALTRAKTSAPNKKASSKNIGYVNISFIGTFLSLVILSDCPRLFHDMRYAIRNIWSFFS